MFTINLKVVLTFFVLTIAVFGAHSYRNIKGPQITGISASHKIVKRGWFRWSPPPSRPPPPPPRIHGGWGGWYAVGSCSVHCGGGSRRYDRLCNNPSPRNGGNYCSGSSTKHVSCNTHCCPVNGGWSSWSSGPCSKTCDRGVQTRRRSCSNPYPYCGGRACAGPSSDTQSCFTKDCPGCSQPSVPYNVRIAGVPTLAIYNHGYRITYSCSLGFEFNQQGSVKVREIRCDAGSWSSPFSTCLDINECTRGTHTCDLTRSTCKNTNGGFNCECLPGYVKDGSECILPVIDGGWSDWKGVGVCSVTCGGGQFRYERKCDNPVPQNGGLPCKGQDYKVEPCNTECCAVHGGWSNWFTGPCSKTCSLGLRTRSRTCTEPQPSCGGDACEGVKSVLEECRDEPCYNCTIPGDDFFQQKTGLLMDQQRFKTEVSYNVLPSGNSSYDHGVKVPYGCQFGYQHRKTSNSSLPTIECDNGQWYGGNECTDVDECYEKVHSCNPLTSTCNNTDGSYQCMCISGFQADGYRKCRDVNECLQSPAPCDQLCRNDKGSYRCYCKDGYIFNETTLQCQRKHKDCAQLPNLNNGQVECNTYVSVTIRRCGLTCDEGYIFTNNDDSLLQECIDGQWTYEYTQTPFPTCQSECDSHINVVRKGHKTFIYNDDY